MQGWRAACFRHRMRRRRAHPKHAPMLRELRRIFDENSSAGRVVFEYTTRIYFGRLK